MTAPNVFTDVELFHKTYGHPIATMPVVPPRPLMNARSKFIYDEITEYKQAVADHDIVEIADALADIIYFCVGTALVWGIPLAEVWEEVQRSNMEKLHTHEQMMQNLQLNAGWKSTEAPTAPGKYIVTDEHGKVRKPIGWQPPDIKAIIDRHMKMDEQNANRAEWENAVANIKPGKDPRSVKEETATTATPNEVAKVEEELSDL